MHIDTADLLTDAANLAEDLVAPLGRRWRHVKAVAEAATALVDAVPIDDRAILVAAAWLHDIGYAPSLVDTGFHSLDGGRYLLNHGWPVRIANLVAHHSGARFEAKQRGLLHELEHYQLEDSPVMDALVTADLTTGPSGERFDYRERIAEILTRYPANDPVHKAWLEAADPMEHCVQRTKWRLAIPKSNQ